MASARSLPSSEPLAISPVTNGPEYMLSGRNSSESSASAGPNSATITRIVCHPVDSNPIRPARRCRHHSVPIITP